MPKATEKTRTVSVHFWNDSWVRKLNALDRYAFLYFLTNPHTTWCGIYELDISMAAFESGIDERDLEKSILPRLSPRILFVDGWICVRNWDKYHASNLPGVAKGVAEALKEVPEEIRLKMDTLLGYPLPTPCVTVTSASALALAPTVVCDLKEKLSTMTDKKGRPLPIMTGDLYVPDGWSPEDARNAKRRLERALGLRKASRWQEYIFGSAVAYQKAYHYFTGEEYVGNIILDEVAKTLADWFHKGETLEGVKEMIIAFFKSDKAKKVTITPNSVFSSHTYNSWKQGKL